MKRHRGRDAPAPRPVRTAIWSTQPQTSRGICTPSFNEHSECPEEGSTRKRRGRSLFTVSAIAKLENLPTSKAAAALCNAATTYKAAAQSAPLAQRAERVPGRGVGATATGVRSRHVSNSTKLLNLRTLHPSLNERSECPGEGWARSTGGEVIHRKQRQQAVEPAHSAPRSTRAASARERGRCRAPGVRLLTPGELRR